ncbi:MAG TPA: hypothetical protein PKC43_06185 [Phycisphaerales bacterium]|nr:hypothetical protein [Phycisphaerales bacterium]HMP37020.1 hypothetical protein [Phycisphaerales bacterium]
MPDTAHAPSMVWVTHRVDSTGMIDISAVVVPEGDEPPSGVDHPAPPVPVPGMTYRSRLLPIALPGRIADQIARSYITVMGETAQQRAQVEPLPARDAAAILFAAVVGSRRIARMIAEQRGCGGGSRDLDLAIGRALIADPAALTAALMEVVSG